MHARSIRRALCVALLLLPAAHGCAMGLMQAYDAALQHDPLYRSAVAENVAGQQYKKLGRASLLPTLQYSYGTSKNKADLTSPNVLGTTSTTHPEYTSVSSSVSLRQTLFNLDALARYRQGIAQTNYSDAQFTSRRQDLMIRLVTAYADANYAQDQLTLYSAQRDAFAEQKSANVHMFEKGEGTRTDMLETQARLDMAEAQVIEALDNLTTARNTLAAMLGLEVMQLDALVVDFKAMPSSLSGFDEWKAIASNNNAELAAGGFAIEAAEQEVSKSRAGHAPRLDLNASYGRNSSDSLTNYKQDSTLRSVGIQLVVPLYAGGYVDALTSQALANRDKARSDLDATNSKVMIELRKQFNAGKSGIARVDALQKSVNSATLLVQATRQSVKGGVRVNLDVLNAEQQLVTAKRDLTQARYNYLISFLKLRVAAGILDIDDLRAVARSFTAVN